MDGPFASRDPGVASHRAVQQRPRLGPVSSCQARSGRPRRGEVRDQRAGDRGGWNQAGIRARLVEQAPARAWSRQARQPPRPTQRTPRPAQHCHTNRAEQLAGARKDIRFAINNGDNRHRKQLLQAVIAEIRVESRDHITPVYRVPHTQQVDTVRIVEGQVVRGGVEPPTSRFSGGRVVSASVRCLP